MGKILRRIGDKNLVGLKNILKQNQISNHDKLFRYHQKLQNPGRNNGSSYYVGQPGGSSRIFLRDRGRNDEADVSEKFRFRLFIFTSRNKRSLSTFKIELMSKRDPLLAKLRTPVHIDFIAKYILKKSKEETRQILNEYINVGIVGESPLAKDYFGVIAESSPEKRKK